MDNPVTRPPVREYFYARVEHDNFKDSFPFRDYAERKPEDLRELVQAELDTRIKVGILPVGARLVRIDRRSGESVSQVWPAPEQTAVPAGTLVVLPPGTNVDMEVT